VHYEEVLYPHALEQVLGILTPVYKRKVQKSQKGIRGNEVNGKWHLAKNWTLANWTI